MRLLIVAAAIVLSGCAASFTDTAGDVHVSTITTGPILSARTPTDVAACDIRVGDFTFGKTMSNVPGNYRPLPDGAEIIWMGGMYNAVKIVLISIIEKDGGSEITGRLGQHMPWPKSRLREIDAVIRQCV